MKLFTPEQIKQANEIDVLTYLMNYEPEELVKVGINNYTTRSHDSLKISNGMWYWFSKGVGGRSALSYLMNVKDLSFKSAMKVLTKIPISELDIQENNYKKDLNAKLILPERYENNNRIINYLVGRGIDIDIIKECIDKDMIYEEKDFHNVVFVGYDPKGEPKYAMKRASNKSRFMQEVYGSHKAFSFKLISEKENNTIHLFESAIDLLSYATILKKENKEWQNENLISLAGVYQPAKNLEDSKLPLALNLYLNNNPNINNIVLHLDNDEAGIIATQAIINKLKSRYEIINDPPKLGKDFNEYLQKKYSKKKEREVER